MNAPLVDLIPLRPAICSNAKISMEVMVRITPPQPKLQAPRPPINLALVLDHSGSMASGQKMKHAKEAAIFAVEQLLPTDRVSVTIFDDEVETIVPSRLAEDKAAIVARLRGVEPDGSTALHAGWVEGATQVRKHRNPEGLNRVLLLSDGLANVGLTSPEAIAQAVKEAAGMGISTTTMGVGDDYNEDLLESMAREGDGNYYYIETPKQLVDIFQTELIGLMATIGRRVSLGLEPQNGVVISDVLNDFDKAETGRLKLPNLIVGMPVEVVTQLEIPPLEVASEVCRFRLAWDEPGQVERQKLRKLLILPAVSSSDWEAMPPHPALVERIALLKSGRHKRQAGQYVDQGDVASSMSSLALAQHYAASAPPSAQLQEDLEAITQLQTDLEQQNYSRMTKRAKYDQYRQSRNRPQ